MSEEKRPAVHGSSRLLGAAHVLIPDRTDTDHGDGDDDDRIADDVPAKLSDFDRLANRTADAPVEPPKRLPGYAPRCRQQRFADTSVYPTLEANIDASVMEFSQEPIPEIKTQNSVQLHGPNTPFRHHTVIREYLENLLNRNGYQDLVEYNTTVERVEKIKASNEWKLTLRKSGPLGNFDYWWTEHFDAVVVASGHYFVPYIPQIDGLEQWARNYPESIEHTKGYRGPQKYRGKVCYVEPFLSIASFADLV